MAEPVVMIELVVDPENTAPVLGHRLLFRDSLFDGTARLVEARTQVLDLPSGELRLQWYPEDSTVFLSRVLLLSERKTLVERILSYGQKTRDT